MRFFCVISLLVLTIAAGFGLWISSPAQAQSRDATVTVTYPPLNTPCFPNTPAGQKLTVVNGSSVTIQVKFNDGLFQTVNPGGSIQFDCTNGCDCYTVSVPGKLDVDPLHGCEQDCCQDVPTLSEWALIALTLLLVGLLTIFIIKRRRPATAI